MTGQRGVDATLTAARRSCTKIRCFYKASHQEMRSGQLDLKLNQFDGSTEIDSFFSNLIEIP